MPPTPPPQRPTAQVAGPGRYYGASQGRGSAQVGSGSARQASSRSAVYKGSQMPTQAYGLGAVGLGGRAPAAGQLGRRPRAGGGAWGQPSRGSATGSRRVVRHVDVVSVLKVSLFFYFCVLVVALVAGAVLWNVARAAGAIDKFDKLVRSLFALSSFQLHPLNALLWGGSFVALCCLFGVLANVVVAVLYNLLSGIIGGVKVVVSSDEEV